MFLDSFKIRFAGFAPVLIAVLFASFSAATAGNANHETQKKVVTMTMDDEILQVISTDPENDALDYVEVYDLNQELVLTKEGCAAASCQVDFTGLAGGTYEVLVYSDLGITNDRVTYTP